MKISRRNFLKLASFSTLGAVACNFFDEREFVSQSPVQLPEDLVTGRDNWYATLSRQYPETEGIVVRVMEGRAKKVQGNPVYPTNLGGHSLRSEAGLQALYHPERIAGPLLRQGPRGTGRYASVSWDQALDHLRGHLQAQADRSRVLTVTGPLRGSMAHLVGSFSNAYGARHVAFQPMEDAAYDQVMRDVLGQEATPTFDFKNANYVLSFGADFLGTWKAPVQFSKGYGEFRQGLGRQHRGSLVQVDSWFSLTAANADTWVPVNPGMEGMLALSVAQVIISEGLVPQDRINRLTGGQGASALDAYAPNIIAQQLGVPPLHGTEPHQVIREIARDFARGGSRSIAIGGGSVSAQTNGAFNLAAIFALNFLVDSVGAEGGVVLNPPAPVPELAKTIPAASTGDWHRTVNDISNGRTGVVMFRGVNPVNDLPSDIGLQQTLNRDDIFVASFSSFMDETAEMADLILPERSPMEDWGDDVPSPGPGFEVIGMQQPVVNPLPGMNPMGFADVLLQLSREMGLDGASPLNMPTYHHLLQDQARKIQALKRGSVQDANFNSFWNSLLQQGGWWDRDATADSSPSMPNLAEIASRAKNPVITGPVGGNTFNLIPFQTVSLADGSGAHLPWLQSSSDPLTTVAWTTWVEISTLVADAIGLREGDFVRVEGANGRSFVAQIYHHPAVPPNVIGIPVGQGHTASLRYSKGRGENPLHLLGLPLEEQTQSLAWAGTRVRIVPTGENSPIPKFEGIVPAFVPNQEEAIVKITRG